MVDGVGLLVCCSGFMFLVLFVIALMFGCLLCCNSVVYVLYTYQASLFKLLIYFVVRVVRLACYDCYAL